MPLSVGRASSVAAVEAALASEDKEIVIVAQRDSSTDAPTPNDLYSVGTRAVIRRANRQKPDLIELMVQGVERVVILKPEQGDNGSWLARVKPLPLPDDSTRETEALTLSLVEMGTKFIGFTQGQSPSQELARMFTTQGDPLHLAFMAASLLSLDVQKEQALLETPTRLDGLRMVVGWLSHEVHVFELRNKIADEARSEMSREQKEYVLRQQKKAIEQELGENNPDRAEIDDLREQLAKADLPEEVRKEAEREMKRLEKLPSSQPEHNVIRTWMEYVLELPWKTRSDDNLDLKIGRAHV